MSRRMISIVGRVITVCMLLLSADGCGSGNGHLAAPPVKKNNSATKLEAEPATTPTATRPSDQHSDELNQDKTTMMPLSWIWAEGMPGTNDINAMEPELSPERLQSFPPEEQAEFRKNSRVRQIENSLDADLGASWPKQGQPAGPGFAVAGSWRDALDAVYRVMVK